MDTLDLYYFSSFTNNTHRFVEKLDWSFGAVERIPAHKDGNPPATPSRPFVLVVPSYGDERRAHVPAQVRKFLAAEEHRYWCVGVIGGGNINFGREFAAAGIATAKKLEVPLLYKFEIAGTTDDVLNVNQVCSELAEQVRTGVVQPRLAARNLPKVQ